MTQSLMIDRLDRDATPAGVRNLMWEAFDVARPDHPQLSCHEGGTYRSYTWDGWRQAAERHAAGLRARGVVPGTRVACVLTNSLEACATILGVWLAGGVVVSLPAMRRGMRPPEYVDQLRRLSHGADASMVLLEERFIELLEHDAFGLPLRSYGSLAVDGRIESEPPADDEL